MNSRKEKYIRDEHFALANETRRNILRALDKAEKSLTATELQYEVRKDVATLLDQLDILEDAGLIKYKLRPDEKRKDRMVKEYYIDWKAYLEFPELSNPDITREYFRELLKLVTEYIDYLSNRIYAPILGSPDIKYIFELIENEEKEIAPDLCMKYYPIHMQRVKRILKADLMKYYEESKLQLEDEGEKVFIKDIIKFKDLLPRIVAIYSTIDVIFEYLLPIVRKKRTLKDKLRMYFEGAYTLLGNKKPFFTNVDKVIKFAALITRAEREDWRKSILEGVEEKWEWIDTQCPLGDYQGRGHWARYQGGT